MSAKLKKLLSAAVAVLMLLSVSPGVYGDEGQTESSTIPAYAGFSDSAGHWADREISRWAGKGIVNGNPDGTYLPDKSISRAEFSSVITRLFNYVDRSADVFSDVSTQDWYYDAVSKAAAAGVITGYQGKFSPRDAISRQEAATIIYRAFALEVKDKNSVDQFADAKSVSGWAKDAVSALVENKYVVGRPGNKFDPLANVTRAETVKIIDNIVQDLKNTAGTYTGTFDKGLIVNTENVTLKDMVINGDLILAQGIAEGTVTLDNVQVKGRTLVLGGGMNSIYIKNSALSGRLIVIKAGGNVRIVAEGSADIPGVRLYQGAWLEESALTGKGFANVEVIGEAGADGITLDGDFDGVDIEAPGVSITVASGTIGKLNVASAAANTKIQLDASAKIGTLTVDAPLQLTGSGTIQKAVVNSPNVSLSVVPVQLVNSLLKDDNTSREDPAGPNPGDPGNPGDGENDTEDSLSSLVFGNIPDEEKCNLSVSGNSGIASISTSVGELTDTYAVRYLDGKDSEMSFTLSDLTPNTPLTLEVEEIHNRGDEVLAYAVLVNGQEQYFRTYEEISAGPNHYFISIDASVIGDGDSVRITFVNYGNARINFSRIWAYSDFENILAEENVYRPMPIALFHVPIASFHDTDWDDYEKILAFANKLKAEYGNYSMYDLALAFDIYYMQWSEEETYRRIDDFLNISKDTGIPVIFSINAWWAGTPSGPDGKGGYWNDIVYNQIVYDPLDVDGRGTWKLSTPNVWGNVPWLSMNNDYYNQVRAEKLKKLAEYISGKAAELKADNGQMPSVSIFCENEPVYWPLFDFSQSPDAAGDFSPLVIEAAAGDGVTLDPTDGLSHEERLWMFNNMNRYITTVTKSIAEGLGYNATVIDNGNIDYPDYQIVENSYTHMFIKPRFPYNDTKRGIWETHMVKDSRFGAEYLDDSEVQYLDYVVARGKFAYVNTARGFLTDFSQLLQAYAYGADYDDIISYYDGDHNLAREVDNKQEEKFQDRNDENLIFSYDFSNQDSLDTNPVLVEVNGVRRDAVSQNYVACPDNGSDDGGEMIFRVDNGDEPLASGLSVVLEGRSLYSLSTGCRIEVWVGDEQENLTLVETLKDFSKARVDVSDAIDKSRSVAYFKIKLYSTGLLSSLYSWSSVWSVRAQTPWGKNSGHTSGFNFTLKQMRERNLWISYRADVERMLSDYLEKAGPDGTYNEIKEQYDARSYVTAYNMLNKALSQLLPAKYIVKGSGTLGKYPVDIEVANPGAKVRTTLYAYGDSVKIGFISDTATDVNITLKERESSNYKALDRGNGIYEIIPAEAEVPGAVKTEDRKATFRLTAPAEAPKQYPAAFEARYYGGANVPEGYIGIQSQDPSIGEYANIIYLKLADDADIRRGAEGDSEDRLQSVPAAMLFDGDLLSITMNSSQEAASIKAYYGKVSGTVTSVQPVSITGTLQNAFIHIRDANGVEHRFEIGSECRLDSPKATGTSILTALVDDLGFMAGDEVTVYYSPYTYMGSEKRAVKITETYDTLISETFEDSGGDWSGRVFSASNCVVAPLGLPYYLDKVVKPDDTGSPAILVWKLESTSLFRNIAVEYSGRAIISDDSSVKWFVSTDNSTWEEMGGIQANTTNDGDYQTKRSILADHQINGADTVYVKCEIRSGFDTWGSLNDVTIKSKASARELETAELTLNNPVAYVGDTVPIALNAFYDNGDAVNDRNVKVVYVSDEKDILAVNKDVIKAEKPGSAGIEAFISDGGRVLKTNSVAVAVYQNVLGSIRLSLENAVIPAGGVTSVVTAVYNAEGMAMDPSQCQITYTSDNHSIATVSPDGTVTGIDIGTANITAQVSFEGISLQDAVPITVAGRRTVLQDDFEGYPDGAVESATDIGAYEISDIQVEPLYLPDLPQKGLSGLFDGGDPVWQFKKDGYMIYRIDSTDPSGFGRLTLSYMGRTVGMPAVGADGTVEISAGEDPSNLTQVGQIPQNGNPGDIYTQDLTSMAQGRNTIYIRVDIKAGRYTWAFLDSIRVEEEF